MREYKSPQPSGLKKRFWMYIKKVTGERSLSKFLWQSLIFSLFSWLPTIVGSLIRGYAYRTIFGSLGSLCLIGKNVRFLVPQRIFLGDRVIIGDRCEVGVSDPKGEIRIRNDVQIRQDVIMIGRKIIINDWVYIGARSIIHGRGVVEIGKYTMISDHVQIISGQHSFKDPSIPIRFQRVDLERGKKIVIESDVWVGANSIILPGVTIGVGSIIGAGSVVTKDILGYSIAVGVPAKVIKKRELKTSEPL